MDDLMARTMVENLSIGINPITGEALSHWDCCSDELVQEALRTVLEHCTLESYASMLKKQREEREAEKKAAREVSAAKRKSMYQNAENPGQRQMMRVSRGSISAPAGVHGIFPGKCSAVPTVSRAAFESWG